MRRAQLGVACGARPCSLGHAVITGMKGLRTARARGACVAFTVRHRQVWSRQPVRQWRDEDSRVRRPDSPYRTTPSRRQHSALIKRPYTFASSAAAFGRWFRVYAIASILIMLVSGAWTGFEARGVPTNAPTPLLGLMERIDIGAYLLWTAVLAVALLRRRDPAGLER